MALLEDARLERTLAPQLHYPLAFRRRSTPVVLVAWLGAASLLLILSVWGRWIFSDQFRPIATGSDPIPRRELYTLYALQAGGVALTAFLVWRFLLRPWIRERRLTGDGLLLLALPFGWFQDPFFNYSQNWLVYNAHLVNLGSWTAFVPGWVSPNQDRFSEPLLVGFGYIFWIFTAMLVGCWAFTRMRTRWPGMTLTTFIPLGIVVCIAIDLVIEWSAVLLGWYALPGGWRAVSLLPGTRWQMPLTEVVIGGVQTFVWVSLRYFRDDRGHTLAERGVDQLRLSPRKKTAVRFLSLCGAVTICGLVFNIPIQWQGLHSDTWPDDVPSYLTGVCPQYDRDPQLCGGPGIPIPRSPHILFGP